MKPLLQLKKQRRWQRGCSSVGLGKKACCLRGCDGGARKCAVWSRKMKAKANKTKELALLILHNLLMQIADLLGRYPRIQAEVAAIRALQLQPWLGSNNSIMADRKAQKRRHPLLVTPNQVLLLLLLLGVQ